jgi:hypothetical protein
MISFVMVPISTQLGLWLDRGRALAALSAISAGVLTVHAEQNKLTMTDLATFKNVVARQCSDESGADFQSPDGGRINSQKSSGLFVAAGWILPKCARF